MNSRAWRRSILGLQLLVLAGCVIRPSGAWDPMRAEAVAWWIEDVTHGLTRDPGEIRPIDGGPRDEVIARWAAGSEISGRWHPPRQIAQRRARWPAVAVAIAQGEIIPLVETGLLAPSADLSAGRLAEVAQLADAENNDRRFVDGLVLVLGEPDPEVERSYHEAARRARAQHDAVIVSTPPSAR